MTPESSASRRFWRFSLGQLLVLFSILGVLLVILAPRVQSKYRLWKEERELWDSVPL